MLSFHAQTSSQMLNLSCTSCILLLDCYVCYIELLLICIISESNIKGKFISFHFIHYFNLMSFHNTIAIFDKKYIKGKKLTKMLKMPIQTRWYKMHLNFRLRVIFEQLCYEGIGQLFVALKTNEPFLSK